MPNVNARIVSVNSLDRALTFTASSSQEGELASSMLNDIKTDTHRAVGTSVVYSMSWPVEELIEAWHAPWTNWSPTATARVRGYSDEAATILIYDSGVILPCPAPAISLRSPWTAITSASAYKHGGGAHAFHWLPKGTMVKKLTVTVDDPDNRQEYLECGRQIVGEYYEVEYNPEYGAPVSFASLSTQYRDGDTNLRVNVGGKFKKQQLSFAAMNTADRDFMIDLFHANGIEVPFIWSLYNDGSDPVLERTHMMYAHLVDIGQLSTPSFRKWSTGLPIESV